MPVYQGFCGPSNPSQSLQADCEQTMNWMLERIESGAAPTGAALYPTPGAQLFLTTAHLEPRGAFTMSGRSFAVIGTGFYEVFAGGTYVLRGAVASDTNLATISDNGAGGQLFITSGGNGYCYVLATNILTQVLTGEATMGGMINARFLAFNISNGKVRLSALNDGTTWDPNLFFLRTLAPDPWQSMLINPPEIWLIGEQTGEVWYDTGAFPQPFAPIPGAFFKYGTPAPFSAAVVGDNVTWLSRGRDGAGRIVAARGYTPQPVSNFAVEYAINTYARTSTIADCEQLVYEEAGHLYSCFNFATAGATWVCDLSMQMAFHQRGQWDAPNGRYTVWGPRVHTYAFGKHLVGIRGSGALAEQSIAFGTDLNGALIRRVRVGPPVWASSRQRLIVSRLELKAESGLGLVTGQGSDPQMLLRTTADGKTWSAQRSASAGKVGDYGRRVFWTRCGSSDKLWAPEIVVTDAIPWRISGAEIDGSGFEQANPQAAA